MGNITNKDALKFIYLRHNITPENASDHDITIGRSDIVFYSDENKIIVDGVEFGLTSQQKSDLTAAYNGLFAAGGIQSRVGTLETKVGSNEALSKALLTIVQELKGKLDGGSYETGGAQGATINVGDESITNAVAAINKLYELVSAAESHAGVQSVNGQQGVVTLTGADIAVSTTNSTKIDVELGKKVAISTDATVKTNTGKKASDYTDTKVIGDAIEAAHAAATSANTNAGNKIAKSPSDTTAKTISGVKGSTLTDAAAIATAIETACERLLKDSNQAQTNWGANEKKTLTTLRDLIKGLQDSVNTITGNDLASIRNSITAIKNELGGEEGGNTRNLVGSFLDAIATILPTKNNNNTYTFNIGTGTGATTATTIQGVIDDLVSRITTAAGAGVTKITNGDGITVTNNGVGNVTVNANSGAKLTAALTTVTNGATTAQGATIQTALNDINAKAAKGIGDAATAKAAADDAQTDATTALNQLKWVVI